MKTKATLLRESALAVPLLLLVGSLVGGWSGALGVALSGLVALGNIALLWVLLERLLRAGNTGAGAAAAVGLLLVKMLALLGAYALLLALFPPLQVGLGLGLVMVGLTISGLFGGLRASNPVEGT